MRMNIALYMSAGLIAAAAAPHAVADKMPSQSDMLCDAPFKIYFGNGIMNSPTNWIASRLELQAAFGNTHHGIPVTYGNAYNVSGGMLRDLETVFAQKISEDPSLSWASLARIWLGVESKRDASRGKDNQIKELIQDIEKKSAADFSNKFEKNYTYLDQKVVNHVAAFMDDILVHGRRVLVIGHSQGGLYANAAYRLLYSNPSIQPDNFGVTGVGTAASFVAGHGAYVTSSSDMIINTLRTLVAQPTLAANVSVPLHMHDMSGHRFVHTYLNPKYAARPAVLKMVAAALDRLVEPASAYDYAIRVDVPLSMASAKDGAIQSQSLRRVSIGICDKSLASQHFCEQPALPNVSIAAGQSYDPDRPEEFGAVTRAIIERLAVRAPEARDAHSALNRFITAHWPVLTAQALPSKAPNAGEKETTADPTVPVSPLDRELIASIRSIGDSASFESGIVDADPKQYGGTPVNKISYRLRICKSARHDNGSGKASALAVYAGG